MVAVLVIVAAVGGAGPIAPALVWAGGRNEAIRGDVNGDGYRDVVYLGIVQPGSCSVIAEYGTASGALRPPVAYTYLRPGGSGLGTPCPDIGVAVDLTLDTFDELVIAWFPGPPSTIGYNLLVLGHDFMPDFGLTQAIFQPSFMGTADFNGDGRQDVYSATDQGQGFETYYSLGDGTLTPGPVKWCSGPFRYLLHDFDRDGAMDVVDAYTAGCTDGATGVVTVRSDGTVQTLQHDPTGQRIWEIKVVYANADSWADIRTRAVDTGEIDYFIQAPAAGPGTFVRSPTAVPDKVTITGNRRTSIAVLANDYATTAARITITTPPRYGTARLTSSGAVVYTPDPDHPSTDRFVYRLTEGTRSSSAPVNIRFSD